jgi:hypothetical protein
MDPYLSVTDYLDTKTFKFSDAFSVEIFDREMNWRKSNNTTDKTAENLTDLFSDRDIQEYGIETSQSGDYLTRHFRFKNLSSFDPPKYNPTSELIKFCNTTRVAYLPNTKELPKLELKFTETDRTFVQKFIKYCLRKNFYDEKNDQFNDSYRPYRYIDKVVIYVWNNNLTDIVMAHEFGSCRLVDYDYAYKLSMRDSSLIIPSIKLSYLSYTIDTNPSLESMNEFMKDVSERSMSGYKPGQSGAYGGGYRPNPPGRRGY